MSYGPPRMPPPIKGGLRPAWVDPIKEAQAEEMRIRFGIQGATGSRQAQVEEFQKAWDRFLEALRPHAEAIVSFLLGWWEYLKAWRLNPHADPLRMREAQANLELWEADEKFAASLGVERHWRSERGIVVHVETLRHPHGVTQSRFDYADGREYFGVRMDAEGFYL